MKPVIPMIQSHSDIKRALENLRSYFKLSGPVIDSFNAKSSLDNIRSHYAGTVAIPFVSSNSVDDVKRAFDSLRAHYQGGGL